MPKKGYKQTREHRRKVMLNLISPEFRRGKTDEDIYGIEKAKEIQEKKSKSSKGRKGISWNKGKTGIYSEKTLQRTSETLKKYYIKNPNQSGRIKKIKLARAKQIFPVKDTKIEVKIQMFLKELGYEYFTHQYMKDIKHGYQCDILVPALNLVIEADGDYWHKYPIGLELDHIRTKELLEKGFKVLRLWECNIKAMDIDKFKKYI